MWGVTIKKFPGNTARVHHSLGGRMSTLNRLLVLCVLYVAALASLEAQDELVVEERHGAGVNAGFYMPSNGSGGALFGICYVLDSPTSMIGIDLEFLAPKKTINNIDDNKITWVNLPVSYRYKLIRQEAYDVFAGGIVAIGSTTIDNAVLNQHGYSITGAARTYELGVLGGASFKMGNLLMLLDVRASYGFFSIEGAFKEDVSLSGVFPKATILYLF